MARYSPPLAWYAIRKRKKRGFDGVVVTVSQPPSGVEGEAYAGFFILISGGKAPYAVSIVSGTLPSGLVMASDGAVSGTPTEAGGFRISVLVTDDDGNGTIVPSGLIRIAEAQP